MRLRTTAAMREAKQRLKQIRLGVKSEARLRAMLEKTVRERAELHPERSRKFEDSLSRTVVLRRRSTAIVGAWLYVQHRGRRRQAGRQVLVSRAGGRSTIS